MMSSTHSNRSSQNSSAQESYGSTGNRESHESHLRPGVRRQARVSQRPAVTFEDSLDDKGKNLIVAGTSMQVAGAYNQNSTLFAAGTLTQAAGVASKYAAQHLRQGANDPENIYTGD